MDTEHNPDAGAVDESKRLIADAVVSTAERLEDEMTDPYEDLDPLEIKVEASLDGEISEIIAVLTVGGPHIEVALYGGRIDGWWGGEDHSVPILDEDSEEMLQEYADHLRTHWEDNVLH